MKDHGITELGKQGQDQGRVTATLKTEIEPMDFAESLSSLKSK
jgi:hypothetical protein